MSTPANDGQDTAKEKKGLSKMVSRMRTVLKRSDGSKRLSFSSRSPAAAAGPSSAPKATTPAPAAEPVAEPTPASGGARPTVVMRSQIDGDRAKKLAERFKLTVDPHEWDTPGEKEAYRVEKPIRMRIHRTCHKCNATFGGNKTCPSCQHSRCGKCPRYPPKKPEGKAKAPAAAMGGTVGGIEADTYYGLRQQLELTKPNPKPGGQPLVRKKPMQRVRRTCHDCSTLFQSGSKTCSNCGHLRCVDCPRDPPKKRRYPDGYPGDAPSSTSTAPIKYTCHQCTKAFPPVPHPSSAGYQADAQPLECIRCGHPKCDSCPRAQPMKVDLEPDPEVLKSVEAKLAALKVPSTET